MTSPLSPQRSVFNSAQLKASKKSDKSGLAEDGSYLHPTIKGELRSMWALAWPVAIATIARIAMYNIDTAFLGHLGVNQLAGGALAMCIVQFITTFLYCPAYGLNSLCSQAIGAGNPGLAGNWLQLSIGISSIAVVPCIVLFQYVDVFLAPLEDDKSVLHYAKLFGRFGSLFLYPQVVYMAIRQYFQAMQIVHPATFVSCVCVGLNVGLNALLIYGVDIDWKWVQIHWDGLGFIGSPLATLSSMICQLSLFSLYAIVIKQYPKKKKAWNGWTRESFKWSRVKNFITIIFPLMIGDASENWAYQIIALLSAQLPTEDVAAMNIINNIWGMLWAVFWGLGLATIIRTGKTIGSGDVEAAKNVAKISLILTSITCSFIGVLCFFFRSDIARIYSSDEKVIHVVDECLSLISLLFVVGGIGWSGSAVFEGLSRVKLRAMIYIATAWLVYVPGAVYLGYCSNWYKRWDMNRVVLIWSVALVVETIRTVVIWALILLRTDWVKLSNAAKKRSEMMLDPKEKRKDEKKVFSINSAEPVVVDVADRPAERKGLLSMGGSKCDLEVEQDVRSNAIGRKSLRKKAQTDDDLKYAQLVE